MKTCKTATPYYDLAIEKTKLSTLKQLSSAILLSAIEDADVEFLTDDYEEWKIYREKKNKKSDVFTEWQYKEEFKVKQEYKDALFDICGIHVKVSDIPKEILEERKKYEQNKMSDLIKITHYKKETLQNMSKLHGWKIGIDYKEPTIFDL